ncbi:hypothetical protein NLX83_33135 [Allokutzneria sp. A3M-2-11 16]|uniref:hypothetical protein n=1 Tax=Allokutzneria sp. A3M-2-11 16 TaxID=2962043 RepID=UPI0020B6FEE5|nr:hypothetical protein [Allokutzneria sp. A3M-2-11 16]MCP3804128.1 hypothetical protein [Allokutzneria sp. A3M-2-11 16]
MFKKMAGAALMALVVASALSVPVQAAPVSVASAPAETASARMATFTLLKEKSGSGRTLRLWKNNSNGLVHANLGGARYGDQLAIGNCCYPYTTYETVTSTGQSELNTGEYGNYGPRVNAKLAGGGEIYF